MNPVSGAALPSSYQQPQHLGGVVVDPKFPPTEEYSQSNYIPSSGADFFAGHHVSQPQHHLQYGYHNHHQPSAPSYAPTSVPIANGGYGGYSNYYHPQIHPHHVHQVRPPLALHTDGQQALVSCHQTQQPPVSGASATSILQNLADIAPAVSQQSGDVNSSACSPGSTGHGDSRGSPPGHSLQELGLRLEDNASDEQDDADDDRDGSPSMEDDDEEDENGDRVIYPWMKKIHVAGVGKCS